MLEIFETSQTPLRARPFADGFLADVLLGLGRRKKRLSCKYFYDARGMALFEAITRTPEYYPTRVETALLATHARELAAMLGPRATVVELGGTGGPKARLLLDKLEKPRGYLPVDISRHDLFRTAEELRRRYPGLLVRPVAADFTAVDLSAHLDPLGGTHVALLLFGSTIGNFTPTVATRLLRRWSALASDATLIIGVDLKKDPRIIHAAYNDAAKLTVAFNKNLLLRANVELGANFDLSRFAHKAFYNERYGRVEMHLESTGRQVVRIGSRPFLFAAGERIHTENSWKYTVEEFQLLARRAGWTSERTFTDQAKLFSVHVLRRQV